MPWMSTWLELRGARRHLARRLERVLEDCEIARGRALRVIRLKPNLGTRHLVLPELEVEAALRHHGAPVVTAVEEARVEEISLGNQVAVDGDEDQWRLSNFRPAHRKLRSRQREMTGGVDWMVDGDVRSFFPSLDLTVIRRVIAELSGLDDTTIRPAMNLLAMLALQHRRLCVGPELASVLGNGTLTNLDHQLIAEFGEELAVRWVDDVTFGVDRYEEGVAFLDFLAHGPLQDLGVKWHPAKTQVTRSESWTPRDASYLDGDALGPSGPVTKGQLPRRVVRERCQRLSEQKDDEAAAMDHARGLGASLCDSAFIIRKFAPVGREHPAVGDAAVRGLLPSVDSPWNDEAAEAMLTMAEEGVAIGRSGRADLAHLAGSPGCAQRVRAAAGWFLASSGTFDQRIIDRLDSTRSYEARALLASGARAGHSFDSYEISRSAN